MPFFVRNQPSQVEAHCQRWLLCVSSRLKLRRVAKGDISEDGATTRHCRQAHHSTAGANLQTDTAPQAHISPQAGAAPLSHIALQADTALQAHIELQADTAPPAHIALQAGTAPLAHITPQANTTS